MPRHPVHPLTSRHVPPPLPTHQSVSPFGLFVRPAGYENVGLVHMSRVPRDLVYALKKVGPRLPHSAPLPLDLSLSHSRPHPLDLSLSNHPLSLPI